MNLQNQNADSRSRLNIFKSENEATSQKRNTRLKGANTDIFSLAANKKIGYTNFFNFKKETNKKGDKRHKLLFGRS